MPRNASNGSLTLMAIVKALIALGIAGAVVWCMVRQIPIEDRILEIILLVISGYFAYSAKIYRDSANDRNKRLIHCRRPKEEVKENG